MSRVIREKVVSKRKMHVMIIICDMYYLNDLRRSDNKIRMLRTVS